MLFPLRRINRFDENEELIEFLLCENWADNQTDDT